MSRFRSLFIATALLPGLLHAAPLKPDVVERAAKQIDRYLGLDYNAARVMPEARVDDGTFVRRAHIAILGRIPTADEARAFLSEKSPDKRRTLVDNLINSKGHESTMFNFWAFCGPCEREYISIYLVHSHRVSP